MTQPTHPLKSDRCPSDCRNGQIWNAGASPYPCPVCQNRSSGK